MIFVGIFAGKAAWVQVPSFLSQSQLSAAQNIGQIYGVYKALLAYFWNTGKKAFIGGLKNSLDQGTSSVRFDYGKKFELWWHEKY